MPKVVEAKAKIGPVEPEPISNGEDIGHCFVIMPFGDPFDKYYSDIFRPAIIDAGLNPRIANDIYRSGDIMRDIWNLTKEAKVVLADLTNRNPNVFYELGLAHALAKPVIIVTQSRDDIPFDLRPQRNIEYDKDVPNWGEILKMKITEYIKKTLDMPLEEILPAFLDFDEKSEELKEERISDSTAERLVEDMVSGKLSKNSIIHEMRKYGFDRNWTIEKIYELEDKLLDTSKQQTSQE